MAAVKQVYLLLICQGFYLGSVCQRWTFPSTITALIGSCVEIPCKYDPDGISGTSSPVWYLYARSGYPEILNTKDSSSVIKEYKARTSLVPGIHSCTLRIDPVIEEDTGIYYYPGIAEDKDINAFQKQSRTVRLDVTDIVNIRVYASELMTEGEASIIQCIADDTCGSSPPYLQWNKPGQVEKKSKESSGGYWREESKLTYIPSYVDDGTPVQCIVTYPNEIKNIRSKNLNIIYSPKNVTVTIIGMDGVMEGGDVTLQCNSFSKPDVYEYEWYKGKTQLPDSGRQITVMKVTRDMEPYSCAAINRVGRGESALTEIPVPYKDSIISYIILPATIGIICLLLLVLLFYFCWRKRCQKLTGNETEANPTYTDLVERDIEMNYYEHLKPGNSTHIPVTGHVGAAHEYENVPK